MASHVEELLDMLYEMIDEAKPVPLSSDRCMVDRDKALDLLDEVRAQFPVELAEAKKLMSSRNEYIASARREADAIRKQAEAEAQHRVSDSEILVQVKAKANEIVRQAEEKSRELRRVANDYCEDALKRTEEAVADAYDEIKQSHAKFRAVSNASASAQSQSVGAARPVYDAENDPGI
jgi:ATP-dependent Clp protease ATP-binding subunit ClpA